MFGGIQRAGTQVFGKFFSTGYQPVLSPSQLVGTYNGSLGDKYEIIKELGRGADGIAYVVKTVGGDRQYVAKQCHPDSDEVGRRKFREEFERMKGLRHPNILKVFEFIESTGGADGQSQLYGITDLAHGGDMDGYVSRVRAIQPLTEAWVAGVFYQLLRGTIYLHSDSVNLAHNDIKPENFLVIDRFDPSNALQVPLVVITDFGRSQRADEPPKEYGDLRYQGPEVWLFANDITNPHKYIDYEGKMSQKCDMWSMGITLYDLLSNGNLPYLDRKYSVEEFMEDDSISKRFHDALKTDEPVPLDPHCSRVSVEAKRLIAELLDKDANGRPEALKASRDPWLTKHKRPIDAAALRSLSFHARKGPEHAVLLNIAAMELQSDHVKLCATIFSEANEDQSGHMNRKEFEQLFAGHQNDQKQLRSMFEAADVNADGFIDFHEFVAATFDWQSLDSQKLEEHLDRIFAVIDKSGSGRVVEADLQAVYRDSFSEEEISRLFKEVDKDEDEELSKNELYAFLFQPGGWACIQTHELKMKKGDEAKFQSKAKLWEGTTSITQAADMLNGRPGYENCPEGISVVYSQRMEEYYLLWRSDKKEEAYKLFNLR